MPASEDEIEIWNVAICVTLHFAHRFKPEMARFAS
jgi:hypothetical protein